MKIEDEERRPGGGQPDELAPPARPTPLARRSPRHASGSGSRRAASRRSWRKRPSWHAHRSGAEPPPSCARGTGWRASTITWLRPTASNCRSSVSLPAPRPPAARSSRGRGPPRSGTRRSTGCRSSGGPSIGTVSLRSGSWRCRAAARRPGTRGLPIATWRSSTSSSRASSRARPPAAASAAIRSRWRASDFDRRLIGLACARLGIADPVIWQPGLMYQLFRPFWYGDRSLDFVFRHTDFRGGLRSSFAAEMPSTNHRDTESQRARSSLCLCDSVVCDLPPLPLNTPP